MLDHPYVDWLDHPGAEALAQRVKQFWEQRGAAVRVWVEPVEVRRAGSVWGVRSDIALRLPRRETKANGG